MLARSSGLEGGLVAALRLHAGSSCQVTCAAYTREQGGRITQLQYLLQLSLRTSENAQNANFVKTEFCEVRCCAQSMQKDCPPSWIAGRILQGRGPNEVMGVRRHPLWCMPDQPITGRGIKEIVTARSWIQ